MHFSDLCYSTNIIKVCRLIKLNNLTTLFRVIYFMKYILLTYTVLLSFFIAKAQTVDGLPATVPPIPGIYQAEPWDDPRVTSINRDEARATAY